jgi:hypothetical protein
MAHLRQLGRSTVYLLTLLTAAWITIERWNGPDAYALPRTLPAVVRVPPASRFTFPPVDPAVALDSDVLALHARGLTGRGIGVAIVDQFLLTGHEEFAERLRWYDELDATADDAAKFHGTAVASIAAGRRVGVAPEADVYFVGLGMIWSGEPIGSPLVAFRRAVHTGESLPVAIDRILAVNRTLPQARRIRALSLSIGRGPLSRAADTAIANARSAGLFVSTFDLPLPDVGRVTIASPSGPHAYTTWAAEPSWRAPYWAGRFALAAQETPSITPADFLAAVRRDTSGGTDYPITNGEPGPRRIQ